MDFSDSYATGVQVVIVKEGSDVTMDNLGDYMIGTQRGTTGYLYASDTPENGGYGEDHVIAYDNGATAVQELINGTIDAVIIDQAPAQEYVAANADAGLTILDGTWVEEQYCLAVDDGNTALLNALNTALNELIERRHRPVHHRQVHHRRVNRDQNLSAEGAAPAAPSALLIRNERGSAQWASLRSCTRRSAPWRTQASGRTPI